jgi:peptidoglycan-N-acetylglucosamine deacetylase
MPNRVWPHNKMAAISLSYDDARVSQTNIALPILDAHGIRATFYVVPGMVPKRIDAWKQAIANGHEIGNHTVTHPCSGNFAFSRANALEDYSLAKIESEILDANRQIHDLLDVTPTTFAYPCGQTYVGRGLNHMSYVPVIAKHFTVGRGAFAESANHPGTCDLAYAFGMDSDGASFDKLWSLVEKTIHDGEWLILVSHDIGDQPRQAIRADVLEQLCIRLADPKCEIWCDTVANVGTHLKTLTV